MYNSYLILDEEKQLKWILRTNADQETLLGLDDLMDSQATISLLQDYGWSAEELVFGELIENKEEN